MPDSSSPSPRSNEPWQAAQEAQMSRGARLFRRWATTSIAICLIALYVYLIIPPQVPQTQIVAVTNASYDMWSVPPIPYSLEDVNAIEEIKKSRDRKDLAMKTLTNPLRGELLDKATPTTEHRFRERFSKRLRGGDALLLYISAHGIAEKGVPYLLCSGDFQLSKSATGRLDVVEILKQLEQCNRKPKLLVLDTGWIAADLRLGMVFNEFPHLVESKVKELKDPNLWVLLTSSMFETCAVVNSQRRSVFGLSFTEAMQGKRDADADGDGLLSLAELYTHLYACCHATQTPLLMQGGKGLIDPRDLSQIDEFVVPVTLPSSPENGNDPEEKEPDGGPSGGQRRRDASEGTANFPGGGRVPLATADFLLAVLQAGGRPGQPEQQPDEVPTEPQAGAAHSSKPPRGDPASPSAADRPAEPVGGGGSEPQTGGHTATDEEPAARSPTTSHQEPSAGKSGTTDPRATLYDAWRFRDRLAGFPLNARDGTRRVPEIPSQGQWSPVDYAPDLWRRLNKLLLHYERLYRSRAAETINSQDAQNLERIVRELKRASRFRVTSPDADLGDGVASQLRRAQQQFWHHLPDVQSADDERVNRLIESVMFYNDMAFLGPCYVRWHAQAILTSAEQTDAHSNAIEGFLDCLAKMRDQLAAASVRRELDEGPLKEAQKDLLDAWRTLESGLSSIREEAIRAISKANRPASARRLENQLNMLYLPAEDRKRMLAAVRDSGKEMGAAGKDQPAVDFRPDAISLHASEWPKLRWERLKTQADFEYQLVCLAYGKKSKQASDLEEQLGKLDERGVEPANALGYYREIGQLLNRDYMEIADRVDGLVEVAKSFEQQLHVWHLMCLEDPRDVRVSNRVKQVVDVFSWINAYAKPKIELAIEPKDRLILDTKSASHLTVSVTVVYPAASNPGASTITLRFGSDLEVHRIDDAKRETIQSGTPAVTLPPGVNHAKLEFQVRCLKPRGPTATLGNLDIEALGPRNCADNKSIPCTRNFIDLVVKRIGFPQQPFERRPPWPNAFVLRPIPNRRTEFKLELINLSGEPKRVDVQLYTFGRPKRATWSPGLIFQPSRSSQRQLAEVLPGIEKELFDEKTGKLKDNIHPITSTAKDAPLELSVDTQPKPVKFVVPVEAAKPSANGAAAAGKKEEAGPEITNGLVCVIHDKGKRERWIKWLEIDPLRPEDYVEASIREQPGSGIHIEFTPKNHSGRAKLPDSLIDPALEFTCHLGRRSSERLRGSAATVSMDVLKQTAIIDLAKPKQLPATIFIDVDGYRRAFAYTIPAYAAPPTEATGRRVELVQLEMGEKKMSFRPNQRAIFRPAGDPLVVHFEVDAHKNDFMWHSDLQGSKAVELGFTPVNRAEATARRFYADRHVTARLAVGEDGRLGVVAKVDDYRVEIDAKELPRGPFRIWVRLVAQKDSNRISPLRPIEDQIEVILDDKNPVVTIHSVDVLQSTATNDPTAGRTIRVKLRVTDWSGIEKIDFEMRRDGNISAQEPAKFSLIPSGKSPNREITVDLPLNGTKFSSGTRCRLTGFVTDLAGNTGSSPPYSFSIPRPPVSTITSSLKKKYGIICGRVKIGSRFPNPPYRFSVALENSGVPKTATREMGSFLFARVPLGKQYTITAKGIFQNREKAGRAEGIEPLPKDRPETADYDGLTIELE